MSASVARRCALLCGLLVALAGAAAVRAAPCDLLGGDGDGDGICDDGNGSGIVGDAPCSCQSGSPPSCVASCDDNCPWAANPDQLDVGRVGAPDLPDRIGDACQCLDVSNDGRGNVLDSVLYRRAVTSHPPPLAAPQKCLGAGVATCDAGDVAPLRNALALTPPAPANVCAAAGACTASADCPAGISCDLGAQRCEKNNGQACVQSSQCFGNGCCADRCTILTSDTANCGSCGITCTNPNGTTSCVGGTCAPICTSGFADCNGNRQDGCETSTHTVSNCGGCNILCNLSNASASCPAGLCTVASCNFGFSNCDNSSANGCEVNHLGNGGTATLGGSADGPGCGVIATGLGVAASSFNVTFTENNGVGTCAATSGLIELAVPVGLDFDLVVTAPAGVTCTHWNGSAFVAGCSGTNGTGQVERIRLVNPESCFLGLGDGVDQTFSATAQVQYFSGSSCGSWQLNVSAGSGC